MTSVRRLSFSRPALVAVVVAAVIFAFWYEALWSAQSRAISSAHDRSSAATAALFTAEQRLGHLKHLAGEAPQLAQVANRLAAAVPDQDHLDTVLVTLSADAATAGVQLGSITVGAPTSAASGVNVITVRLAVRGGYFGIEGFLDTLRQGSRAIVVDTVSLSGSEGGAAAPANALSAAIGARVFVSTSSDAAPLAALAAPHPGTGVLETPINAAKTAATAATNAAAAAARSGGTP